MFDFVRVEGHEVPGIDPEYLEEWQGPVQPIRREDGSVMQFEGHAVYEDGDLRGNRALFQSKSMERSLMVYVIKDGGLIYERGFGSEDIRLDYTGDLIFYGEGTDYIARFRDGVLLGDIERRHGKDK